MCVRVQWSIIGRWQLSRRGLVARFGGRDRRFRVGARSAGCLFILDCDKGLVVAARGPIRVILVFAEWVRSALSFHNRKQTVRLRHLTSDGWGRMVLVGAHNPFLGVCAGEVDGFSLWVLAHEPFRSIEQLGKGGHIQKDLRGRPSQSIFALHEGTQVAFGQCKISEQDVEVCLNEVA